MGGLIELRRLAVACDDCCLGQKGHREGDLANPAVLAEARSWDGRTVIEAPAGSIITTPPPGCPHGDKCCFIGTKVPGGEGGGPPKHGRGGA